MARLTVRLTPRGGANAIDRIDADGTLHARVSVPPADGRANAALVRLLARALRVPLSSIAIMAGERGRTKIVDVAGMSDGDLQARISSKFSGGGGAL